MTIEIGIRGGRDDAADWRFWYQRIDAVRAMLRAPGGGADARPARRPLSHRPPAGVEFVPARWQDQIFRSRADAVTIQVAVKSGNKPVAGLTAADFDLRDNGVPQEIKQRLGREGPPRPYPAPRSQLQRGWRDPSTTESRRA